MLVVGRWRVLEPTGQLGRVCRQVFRIEPLLHGLDQYLGLRQAVLLDQPPRRLRQADPEQKARQPDKRPDEPQFWTLTSWSPPKLFPLAIASLTAIGYQGEGELGIPGRHALRSPADELARHVYVCVDGCLALRNHLAVRDVLRGDCATCFAVIRSFARSMGTRSWHLVIESSRTSMSTLQARALFWRGS